MATWGRDSKRGRSTTRTTSSRSSAPRSTSRPTASTSQGRRSSSTPTRNTATARDRAGAELRGAVEGREHEFIGFGFVAVAVLLGLAIYFNLAGPVGRGVETLVGWFTGLARYAVPIALGAVGVSFIRKGKSSSPFRLVVGWALIAASVMGLAHVINGPGRISAGFDDFANAGGWIGALVAEPLRALVASAGAVVVLLALGVGGALLVTSTSLKTFAQRTSQSVGMVARPIGRAAKRTMDELSSLSSDRTPDGGTSSIPGEARPLPSPTLYDLASEDDTDWSKPPAAAGRRSRDSGAGASATGRQPGQWVLPASSLLKRAGKQAVNSREVEARGAVLHESLEQHGVDTALVGTTVGPTVTRYELELAPGVKVARVTNLQKDIAYAMAATDVRILAPIPGRSAIGVEVPNHTRHLVPLGDLLSSPEAVAASDPLDVAVGKDIAGRSVFLDLATTPHLLIAGATGAGKSSALNCIITSLLMRSSPDDVRLILIDPKQVEMGQYNRLPHLLTQPVTDPKKAANALAWAVKEMERRYDLLFAAGTRDITGYNQAVDRGDLTSAAGDGGHERLPFIVVVVDELNDLMMVAARDVEDSITRIAQKARAVGIHLIVATQRPSVNVITGVIKANIPARVAFAVSSLTDSRVILDQPGAEKLVGMGDMLLLPGNSSVPQRIQGAWVTEDEVRAIVTHWREQAPDVGYVSGVGDGVGGDSGPIPLGAVGPAGDIDEVTASSNTSFGGDDDEDSTLMRQAMELVVRSQLGSTSMLQRKLKVGFARAGRIMDLLEQQGVVGPSEGSKARAVLMTVEEFELLQQAEHDR
jgi:S-DNA-T family DNA segregation ATPase FtsK/SpoIIIE